jgi:hypothetical protein
MSNAIAPGAGALPDDREYMTPVEFAALPSDVHHAVWAAAADKRVGAVPASGSAPRRYRRAQVQAIMRGLEAARTAAAAPGENAGTAVPGLALAAAGPGGRP